MMIAVTLQAQVIIEAGQPSRQIFQQQATWFVDKTGSLSFDQIKESSFIIYDKKDFIVPKKNENSWARLSLTNKSGQDQEYILQTGKWGFFEAFITSENTATDHLISGSLVPLQLRSQSSNTNAIKIFIGRDENKIIFLKFNPAYSIYMHDDINLQLVKQTTFEKIDRQRLLWQGLFFGIILVMALYNLFILLQ